MTDTTRRTNVGGQSETLGAAWASGANRVLDAPTSRAASWLLLAMLAVVLFALGWAVLASTDRVATAEGQTIPDRRVQRIQTPEQGTIERLLVEEGDQVEAGAELVHIDRVELEAEFDRARTELLETRARILRFRALGELLDQVSRNGFHRPEGKEVPRLPAMPDDWSLRPDRRVRARQADLLAAEWRAYLSEVATSRQELAQRRSQVTETETELAGRRQLMPYVEGQRDRLRRMADLDLAPDAEFEETQRALLEESIELESLEVSLARNRSAVDAARSALVEVHARHARDTARQRVEAEARAATLRHELRQIRARLDRRAITTPIGGTVMDVQVHGPGEVVEPGSAMMKVVPRDSPLEVQAYVSNRDIGRVRRGDEVNVKFEAFDFTRYGSMPGELVHVSRDAAEHEELGHVYPVLVRMERDYMRLDGERIRLIPGMDVTVDIDLGERRVIEYFLSPLLRYQDEALREP